MIAVWGGIAYQVIGGLSSDEMVTTNQIVIDEKVNTVVDSFKYELNLNYKDPFAVSTIAKRNTSVSVKNNQKRPLANKKVKQEPVNKKAWPTIRYGGLVKSSNNKKVALLTISGSNFLAKEGELLKEILVKKYTEDFIVVEFDKEEKTIKK